MKISKARVHTLILVLLLAIYGVYSLSVAIQHEVWYYGFGGIFALIAGFLAATGKRWSRPFVWTLGLMIVLSWVLSIVEAYRSGVFHWTPSLELLITFLPGIALVALVGYCCYVVNTFVVGSQQPT